MNAAAAAAGSAAPVTAEATATRVHPSAVTWSMRSSVMPPMATVGSVISRATAARKSGGAKAANDFVAVEGFVFEETLLRGREVPVLHEVIVG